MTRWIYLRPLADNFTGHGFHLSLTGDTGGAVPGRVIESRDELDLLLRRAGLERLINAAHSELSKGQIYNSGPLDLTPAQELILMPRDADPSFRNTVQAVIAQLQKKGATHDYCTRCGTDDWHADLVRLSVAPMLFDASRASSGPQSYMLALAIVCKNCGNTLFHNLNILEPEFLKSLGIR